MMARSYMMLDDKVPCLSRGDWLKVAVKINAIDDFNVHTQATCSYYM